MLIASDDRDVPVLLAFKYYKFKQLKNQTHNSKKQTNKKGNSLEVSSSVQKLQKNVLTACDNKDVAVLLTRQASQHTNILLHLNSKSNCDQN